MALWGSLQVKFGLELHRRHRGGAAFAEHLSAAGQRGSGVPLQGDQYDRQRVGGGVFSGGPGPAESGKRGGCHGSGGGDGTQPCSGDGQRRVWCSTIPGRPAAPLESTPSIPRSCRHWRDMTPFPAPTGTGPSAAARPLRCCIRTGSSARCTPTNTTQSRRRCCEGLQSNLLQAVRRYRGGGGAAEHPALPDADPEDQHPADGHPQGPGRRLRASDRTSPAGTRSPRSERNSTA